MWVYLSDTEVFVFIQKKKDIDLYTPLRVYIYIHTWYYLSITFLTPIVSVDLVNDFMNEYSSL